MLILAVFSTMVLTACGGSKSLEQYVADNPEMQESIDSAKEGSNVEIKIEGNEITYIFDLSKMDGYSEDIVKDEEVISSLETSLISSGPTFGGISKQLEEQTKVKGITTTVNYTWEDEVLITKSFTSADAVEDPAE